MSGGLVQMMRKIAFLLSVLILFPVSSSSQSNEAPTTDDSRQLVSMPDEARNMMREEMLSHLSTMHEIIRYLADNNLEAAAATAESRMGKSSMGKHRAGGMGPGRFMPLAMRNIGFNMHESATALSQAASNDDLKGAYDALQNITASCVACHRSYRTR